MLASILDTRESHAPASAGYYYQQLALLGWSSYLWLKKLRMPTLVLHGADDPVVPLTNARRMAARIPDANLEIVPGAGHLILFDEAEKAGAVLERFLG